MKLFHLLLLFLSTVLLAYGEVTESYLRTEILGLANSSVTERRFEAAMLFRERWRFLGPKEATDIAARLLADGEVRVTEEMLLSLKGMAPTEPEFNRF
jgi:hypothetical protein